jgi:hypothetical protein
MRACASDSGMIGSASYQTGAVNGCWRNRATSGATRSQISFKPTVCSKSSRIFW